MEIGSSLVTNRPLLLCLPGGEHDAGAKTQQVLFGAGIVWQLRAQIVVWWFAGTGS